MILRPWEKACIVPANITATSVPDLKEGEEYEFRVIAVNKGGPGEPSKASAPVTCKPRFGKLVDLANHIRKQKAYMGLSCRGKQP